MTAKGSAPAADARPFVLRLVTGDIAAARATLIAVNHFNGVPASGAEAAIDAALGGAISRWAARGALQGHFGGSYFFPAVGARLAASAVLVIGLGEVEKFTPARLPELGVALVEAAASCGIPDAATILHGGGTASVPPLVAARRFAKGLFRALEEVPGAEQLREVTIVEIDPAKLPDIARGIRAAPCPARVHVYFETGAGAPVAPAAAPRSLARPDAEGQDGMREHLRVGITHAENNLKITVIGNGPLDLASACEYPGPFADSVVRRIQDEILNEEDSQRRVAALRSMGQQISQTYLGGCPEVLSRLGENEGEFLVLRLDGSTAKVPWELLFLGDRSLSRTQMVGRQLEVYAPGRAAAFTPVRLSETLRILVVGDPASNLPAAAREADEVAKRLGQLPGVQVTQLIGNVSYHHVSRELATTRYDVLHYAGHAEFGPTAGDAAGLVLRDRLLTASDLSTRTFLPRLVFANGCYTAALDDEDDRFAGAPQTQDLVTGLLSAGVRTFIGAMWRVDDDAAATFAETFYRSLLQPDAADPTIRTSVGKAILDARRAVVEEHGEAQVAWAAYALYGAPWMPGV